MHTFFNREITSSDGEPVEIMIANLAIPTNRIINVIESRYKQSGKRFILFHDPSLDKLQIEESVVKKILSQLCEDYQDMLIGYHILSVPTMDFIIHKCGEFAPIRINCPDNRCDIVKMGIEGINAVSGDSSIKTDIQSLPTNLYQSVMQSLEGDDMIKFKDAVPSAVKPYWSVFKNAYDKHTYL